MIGAAIRLFAIALLMLASLPSAVAAPPPLPRDSVYRFGAPLTDQSGRRLTLADKRGTAQVVVMFYSSCNFSCPTIVDTLQDLERKLAADERKRLGVLMISFDPQRDTPAALNASVTTVCANREGDGTGYAYRMGALPSGTRMMCTPNVNAICARAQGTGSTARIIGT